MATSRTPCRKCHAGLPIAESQLRLLQHSNDLLDGKSLRLHDKPPPRAQSAGKLTLQSVRFIQSRSLLGGEILGHSGDIIIGYGSGDALHDRVFAQQSVEVP